MKLYKKLVFFIIFLILPLISFAAETPIDPFKLINNIAKFFSSIVIGISVIIFIYAGFLYTTAGGNTEKIDQAKNYLLYGAIGLGISAVAFGITGYVTEFFTTLGH